MDSTQKRNKVTAQMDSDPSVPAAAGAFVRDPAASSTGNRILPGVDHRAQGERVTSGVTQTRQSQMDSEYGYEHGLTDLRRFSQVSISRLGPKDPLRVPEEKEKERVIPTRAGRTAAKKMAATGSKKNTRSPTGGPMASETCGSVKEEDDGVKVGMGAEEACIPDPFTPRKSLSRSPPRGLRMPSPGVEQGTAITTASSRKKAEKSVIGPLPLDEGEEDVSTDYESGRNYADSVSRMGAKSGSQTDISDGVDRPTKTAATNKRTTFKQPKAPAKKRNTSARTYQSDAGTTENDGTEGDNTEGASHMDKNRELQGWRVPERADKRIGALLDTFTQLVKALLPESDTEKVAMVDALLTRVKDIITGTDVTSVGETPTVSQATGERRSEKRKYNFTSPPVVAMPEKKRSQGTGPLSGSKAEEPWITVASKARKRTAKAVPSETVPLPNPMAQSRMENAAASECTEEIGAKLRKRNRKMINKGEAIIVPLTDKENYHKTMGEIREGLGNCQEGIRKVRLTRGGNILLELEKDPICASKVQEKLREKMGPDVLIRKLTPSATIEFRDVDPTVTVEEADARFREAMGITDGYSEKILSVKIRRGPMGTQIVSLVAPLESVRRLMEIGRLRLGLTVVTPRLIPRVTQCMACCGFGHFARECRENPNGPPICRGCGLSGHKMEECTKPLNCTLCRKDGLTGENLMHLAGGTRCPVYRREINKIRKNGG